MISVLKMPLLQRIKLFWIVTHLCIYISFKIYLQKLWLIVLCIFTFLTAEQHKNISSVKGRFYSIQQLGQKVELYTYLYHLMHIKSTTTYKKQKYSENKPAFNSKIQFVS